MKKTHEEIIVEHFDNLKINVINGENILVNPTLKDIKALMDKYANQYPSQPERVEGVDWEAVGDYLDASWGKANRDYLLKELQHRFFPAAPSAVDWNEIRNGVAEIIMAPRRTKYTPDAVIDYLKNTLTAKD